MDAFSVLVPQLRVWGADGDDAKGELSESIQFF
jgi:hypothetical protein